MIFNSCARSDRHAASRHVGVPWLGVIGVAALVMVMGSSCTKEQAAQPSATTAVTTPTTRATGTSGSATVTTASTGTQTSGDDPSTTFFTIAKTLPNGAKWDAFTDQGGKANGKFQARVDYSGPNNAEIQVYGPATIDGSKPLDMAANLAKTGQLTDASAPELTTMAGQEAAKVSGTYNGKSVVVIVTGTGLRTFVARMDSPPADLDENSKTFQGVIDSMQLVASK